MVKGYEDEQYPTEWEEPTPGYDQAELDLLVEKLDLLVTGDTVFDNLVDSALDWLEGTHEDLDRLKDGFAQLDLRLAQELLGARAEEDVLPENLETLQRLMQMLQRSIDEEDGEFICLALMQLGKEIPECAAAARAA